MAIVDYRNFSKAADKLNIAQSSVSTHLLQLEKELGVKLVNRTTKAIEITDVGFTVYKYACQILELKKHIYQTCCGDARRILRIAASTTPAAYLLPGILQQYKELFPNDCLKINQCDSKTVIEGVLTNRFDVGLVGQTISRSGLKCVPICRSPIILITPATERYLEMQKKGTSIAELLKEPIILREEGQEKTADRVLDKIGIDRDNLTVVARVNDQETVKHMVASGMGISLISEIAAQDFLRSRRLLKFDLPKHQLTQNINLIYLENRASKDQTWNFVDYLLESNNFTFRIS